ncbi:Indigoidine synthase A like protein-domain-containing protein [Dichotomopilus funicola]|uniref:Indigoidine synthase A like protein-domain-containing protein n=1 Tax=Dichotomopilus funicola TaxID=1934379 RepID=A0AAN6V154_9PEZI|nr:Indigoidine synthase A like protein-domain-containing protein [Dichotomopilus funicola]
MATRAATAFSRGSALLTPRNRLLSSRRFFSSSPSSSSSLLKISPEVTTALARNQPVVALESTIYTHGALGDDLDLEGIVRAHGAVPAVCGILAGQPTVGLTPEEVSRMVREGARKASRRDLAFLSAPAVRQGSGAHGGTTISGTMVLARLAGIRVFGTGGLGGVHRGGEVSMDVSADLTELGRTRVAVISSGCKGFLDIPRTLEFLETQGAFVSTFADGRDAAGKVDFPAFWARESGVPSPAVVRDEQDAAAIILAQEQLGIESGLLFANPIPEEAGIPRKEMEAVIETAVREATEKGFTGNANTPYVLQRIRELTQGRSVPANKALVQANVARAAKVSVELAKLMDGAPVTPRTQGHSQAKVETSTAKPEDHHPVDVLVAGSVALDLSCDYAPLESSSSSSSSKTNITASTTASPALHTSNPSAISQSIGGVGHNLALAAHRVSGDGKIRLYTLVGNDIAGSTILSALRAEGMDTSMVQQLDPAQHPGARTAQYVAVNDANKNLVMAMADMDIFTNHTHTFPGNWTAAAVAASRPKWVAVDANWSADDIQTWLRAAADHDSRVAYEPVSAAKSQRLFPAFKRKTTPSSPSPLGVFPSPSVHLCTPNQYELRAMYDAATRHGYLDHERSPAWFAVLDAFGILSGARERFLNILTEPISSSASSSSTSSTGEAAEDIPTTITAATEIIDAGIPVQCINLLPYIPTLLAKLGPRGALLVTILSHDDPRLRDLAHARYVVSRTMNENTDVGGVYMRLFPAAERVDEREVVSVNGIGDTFMGVLVAGLAAQGGKGGCEVTAELVDVAQRAAVLTLKSRESVSVGLKGLRGDLRRAVESR